MTIRARSLDFFESEHIGHYDLKYRVVSRYDEKEDPHRFVLVTAKQSVRPGEFGVWAIKARKIADLKTPPPGM